MYCGKQKKTIKLFNQKNIDRLRTVLHRFEGFWSNFTWQITNCLVPYPITPRPRQCFWPCISLLNQCKLVIASLHLFTCTQNLMKVCFRIRMSTVTKKSSLGKQLTFCNATFGFPAKWLLRKEHGIPNRWRIIIIQIWEVLLIGWSKCLPDLGDVILTGKQVMAIPKC